MNEAREYYPYGIFYNVLQYAATGKCGASKVLIEGQIYFIL